jgi:cell division protein FtsL
MKILFLLFVFVFFFRMGGHASTSFDSLLKELDQTLEDRWRYEVQKQQEIQALKDLLRMAEDSTDYFGLYGRLFDVYLPFNTDSAYRYAQLRWEMALAAENSDWRVAALLNRASVFNATGLYKEAVDILDVIDVQALSYEHKLAYFHLGRTVYGAMADFAPYEEVQQMYMKMVDSYRDSVLFHADPGTSGYALAKYNAFMERGDFQSAIALLWSDIEVNGESDHYRAIVFHLIANAWLAADDMEQAVYFLTLSSIHDLKAAVKEYISLWQLAELLYEAGDVDRAYRYLQTSLDDATSGKARLRTIRISEIYPIIEAAYQAKIERQQQQLRLFLLAITFLAVILVLAIVLVMLQMKRLRSNRQALRGMNEQLAGLNAHLTRSNNDLKELNQAITDSSLIKEEYIGRYMEQCSLYLTKMEDYRRSLKKIVVAGPTRNFEEVLKSSALVDEELREFYEGFDDTFLRLFPTFVQEFNDLLMDSEQVVLKPGERMNTELRIYALIRLGITDSDKIAHFLRYSISTIYNYRTKLRNKAAGDRQEFENQVSKIGLRPIL